MNPATVLIVDDDAEMRELIAMYLEEQRYQTIEASDGDAAIRQFRSRRPDLILLDVKIPGTDGYEVCRQIRAESSVPIIFLSGRWESVDIVRGLDIGGDDYVTKPFSPDVLLARVKTHLRRAGADDRNDAIRFGDLHVYKDTGAVVYRGREIPFLAKELKLFRFMAEHTKQVFHADQLYELVWDYSDGDSHTVMVHISSIRKKLAMYAPDTVYIETIKGMGYRLMPVDRGHVASDDLHVRQAIIEAAAQLFADRGYEGMTMKEIAARVGIKPSAIYSLFSNKEDLFLHIYRSIMSSHLEIATNYASMTDTSVQSKFESLLQSVIQYQLREASKMKIFIRILLFPSGYFEKDLKSEFIKLEQQEHELFMELFKKGMECGEIREGDCESLSKLLICLMDGLFWEMQRYDQDVFLARFDEVWRQFWQLVKR